MAESDRLGSRRTPDARNGSNRQLDPSEIYQLVYFSTSLLPPLDAGGDREIRAILETAHRCNSERGITGALTYNEFHFAQVLEGARADVGHLFRLVQRDRRHMRVVVAQEGWVAKRDFTRWAMAYVGDPGSLRVISPNLQLREIIGADRTAAMSLIEMMKFFLLNSSSN